MRGIIIPLIIILLLVSFIPCNGQYFTYPSFTIELGGGVSVPVGSTRDGWLTGAFTVADVLAWPKEFWGIGLRFAFDWWPPDVEKRLSAIDSLRTGIAGGTTKIYEVIPSTRISTVFNGPINVFGQFGTGLFVLRQAALVSGTTGAAQIPFELKTVNDWSAKWGIQVGPGISLINKSNVGIDIITLYNIVFKSSTLNYFTTNASIRINF